MKYFLCRQPIKTRKSPSAEADIYMFSPKGIYVSGQKIYMSRKQSALRVFRLENKKGVPTATHPLSAFSINSYLTFR